MAFSPLADTTKRVPDVGRSSPRLYAISGVGVHYQYGKNIHTEATNPAREVSANYWIDDDGTIRPNIDENLRAWTSGDPAYPAGALADHRNITVEVSCTGSNTDRISAAALAALARLIADIYKRHKLGAVKRSATSGVGVHSDWVATACPGDYMRERLPSIIRDANQINQGGLTMSEYKKLDAKLDKIYDHISHQARVTRGSSQLGWIKSTLWQLLHREQPIDLDIDVAELAAELREAFGDELAAAVAEQLTITTKAS